MNRRHFLLSSAGVAATGLVEAPLFAQGRGGAQMPNGPLPPAIAALTNRVSGVKPITIAERQERCNSAQTLMAKNKIDAIVITSGTSLVYFTGMRGGNSERLFAWVLPVKGPAFIICPVFEEERMRELTGNVPGGDKVHFYTWDEHENPYALLGKGLKDAGLATGNIGVEEQTKFAFSDGFAHALPAAKIVSATPVTAGCRGMKSAHELELMKLANDITWHVYEAAWKSLTPGMTTRDASALISAAYMKCGVSGYASVEVDEFSALPHGSIKPQTLKEGSIVMIDDGCTVEGYQSDITRTFVLGGKATDKQKQVFEIVRKAQAAALAAAKPGAPCEAIDIAARKVITDAGYGPDYKFFTHRLGHGIGMDGHEWPYLVRGNKQLLAVGNTFSDEPGVYIRGEFGVRLEDDWVMTENGGEMFTPTSKSIEEPFAV
ncbi:aminopeptidase P family protein [Terriglobus albidus]|uniref:Aminopeptidase P family protein n=1 Tax=Terriglobus albidus TaxID=1592106 RepID=A0A5B9EFJ9_9BACT|nr:Xaa-Pro peptidase family protein [Terriglobus albidus]QEE30852.1 aminopeptidase P family protein [Terriglobus albidus]